MTALVVVAISGLLAATLSMVLRFLYVKKETPLVTVLAISLLIGLLIGSVTCLLGGDSVWSQLRWK